MTRRKQFQWTHRVVELVIDLLDPNSISVAIDAQRSILRQAGAYHLLTAEQERRLYEDAVIAVLEHLNIEVPA